MAGCQFVMLEVSVYVMASLLLQWSSCHRLSCANSCYSALLSPSFPLDLRGSGKGVSGRSSADSHNMFPFAPQPDLYRSAQKDDAVLHKLRDDVSDLALQLGGQRWAHRQAELDMLASAAYYGLTQLTGGTTLGEEYCDLLMVAEERTAQRRGERAEHSSASSAAEEKHSDSESRAADSTVAHASQSLLTASPTSASSPLTSNAALPISSAAALPPASTASALALAAPSPTSTLLSPSPLFTSNWVLPSGRHRACLFVLQVVVPYLYVKAKKQYQTLSPPLPSQPTTLSSLYHHLLSLLPSIDSLLPHLHRLHLALFFLSARFVSLSHRLVGLRFVHLRQDVANSRPSYTGLGVLLLIQLTATAAVKSWQAVEGWQERKRRRGEDSARGAGQGLSQPRNAIQQRLEDEKADEAEDSGNDERVGAPQCILHLGPVRNATATECGHVYCWNCIAECCKQKPECPLCRTPISLDNLLLLVNYT